MNISKSLYLLLNSVIDSNNLLSSSEECHRNLIVKGGVTSNSLCYNVLSSLFITLLLIYRNYFSPWSLAHHQLLSSRQGCYLFAQLMMQKTVAQHFVYFRRRMNYLNFAMRFLLFQGRIITYLISRLDRTNLNCQLL